ncbi:MAG TPA: peptidoglycan-binding domain-containing protein [Candidatus Paceibacterota bacterium]
MKTYSFRSIIAAVVVIAGMVGFASSAQAATYTSTSSYCRMGSATLRVGSRGNSVSKLQEILSNYFDEDISQDGVFGRMTRQYVRDFQSSEGLYADGVVGSQTRAALTDWCEQDIDGDNNNNGNGNNNGQYPTSRTGSFGQSITLYRGDSVKFTDGMVLDVVSIDDSRCSGNNQCFWQGDLAATVRLYGGSSGTSREVRLSTYSGSSQTIDGYTIKLYGASSKSIQVVVTSSYNNVSNTVEVGREFSLYRGQSATIQGRSITLTLEGTYGNLCEAQNNGNYCTMQYQPVAKVNINQANTNRYGVTLTTDRDENVDNLYLRLISIENPSGQQSARFILKYSNDYYNTGSVNYDTVSGITNNSATLSASFLSSYYSQTGYFEYGTSSNNLYQKTSTTSLSQGRMNKTLYDLTSNTTYYYRAVIIEYPNGSNTPNYKYGDVRSFTTSNNYNNNGYTTLTTNSATNVTYNSATLSGYIDGVSNYNNGTVYFEYGTNSNDLYQKTSSNSVSNSSVTQSVYSLQPNTTYYYRIVVDTLVYGGDGARFKYGDIRSFTTSYSY